VACLVLAASGDDREARTASRVDVVGVPTGKEVDPGLGPGGAVTGEALERGAELIRQALVDAGYLGARVEVDTVADAAGLGVTFRVEPGPLARVSAWELVGCRGVDSSELAGRLPGAGAVLSARTVATAVERVLRGCAARGYPLAGVTPASMADEPAGAVVCLLVDEGPLVRVAGLDFAGTSATPAGVMSRMAVFRPGTVYSPRAVAGWSRNLVNTGLFDVGGHEVVAGGDGGHRVRLAIRERRANRAYGALGYVPGGEGGGQEVTGFVDIGLRNILNSGRRFEGSWRSQPDRVEYHAGYTEPWLFGWWLSATGRLRHVVVDTSRSLTSGELELGLPVSIDLTVSFASGFERVASLDTTENARSVWAGTGFVYDIRDPGTPPRSGLRLALATRLGERRGQSGGSGVIGRAEGDVEVLGPARGWLVPANALHARVLYSATPLPEFELFHMGGAASLRGYREDEFTGSRLGWWNAELRVRVAANASAYPFFDWGAVDAADGWRLPAAYGLGTKVDTRLGIFGLDYGVAVGESPARGKVHISYAGEF